MTLTMSGNIVMLPAVGQCHDPVIANGVRILVPWNTGRGSMNRHQHGAASASETQHGETARQAVAEATRWLYGTLMRPAPDLGRKGAVCPYLDQAAKVGRVSLNVVHVEDEHDFQRLAATAADWLERIRGAAEADGKYESVLFLPVGAPDPVLVDCVTRVQRELRARALDRGCMVGEFFPGHPMPGIHNPAFRPLTSPRPILGIRTMVDTDILFLSLPSDADDRRRGIQAWFRFFADRAAPGLLNVYERARRELGTETGAVRTRGAGAGLREAHSRPLTHPAH
jgi:Domain of unknown function (DUF6875)